MLQIRRAKRCDAEAAFDIRFQAIQNQCSSVYTNDQVVAWTCVPLTDKYRSWVEKRLLPGLRRWSSCGNRSDQS